MPRSFQINKDVRMSKVDTSSSESQCGERLWISEGLVDLQYRMANKQDGYVQSTETGLDCDVLIIGSGYGAAVCAAALGETIYEGNAPRRIWLLERGEAYLPGQFPNQLAQAPVHVRFNTPHHLNTKGNRSGLFDVRVSDDVSALVANGLGGGSLINAGVMAWPNPAVFRQSPWPLAIAREGTDLQQRARAMMVRLGATLPGHGGDNTIDRQPQSLAKFDALKKISSGSDQARRAFKPTPITVAMCEGDLSADNVRLTACNRCGDCATGCNQGAKISLDTNLLASAARRGVRLFTGATVMHLSQDAPTDTRPSAWIVHVQHTDPQTQWRHGQPIQIRAGKVIVAAGTFGSTGILLRSKQQGLALSDVLGERFSANGDLVMTAYDQRQEVRAIASENVPHEQRQVGPTITGMIDCRSDADRPLAAQYVVQDLAVPAVLDRIFSELNTTAHAVHQLGQIDRSTHHGNEQADDPLSVHPDKLRRTFPLAIIGHDTAQGRIQLVQIRNKRDEPPSDTPFLPSDGAVSVTWPQLRNDPRFDAQLDELKDLCASSGTGGTLLPNPGWKPVPKNMEFLVDGKRGPLFTAHPLGGCPMGTTVMDGVVNDLGQVFAPGQPSPDAVHEGLVVLDGSIMPTSLGINPSLTIATLADRAIRRLIAQWQMGEPRADVGEPRERPKATAVPLPSTASTHIEISEQMRGDIGAYKIEITLRFEEIAVSALLQGQPARRTLTVNPAHSFVRVIDPRGMRPGRPAHKVWDEGQVVLKAQLGGHLYALHRDQRCAPERIGKAFKAWVLNRGLRDVTQLILKHLTNMTPPDLSEPDIKERVLSGVALASRAGEVRLLEYDLLISKVLVHEAPWASPNLLEGQRIKGRKKLTYSRRGNPWEQLMTMTVDRFPGLNCPTDPQPTLKLNMAYLADIGVPLLRITRQRDMPSALMDLTSLALLFVRVLMNIHVWSMRAVDEGPEREAIRLPGFVPGLPPPQITELDVDAPLNDDTPVRVRLTRYPTAQPGRRPRPLVMLHGYSASGTTFAHHAVQPGLAKFMWDQGHDIWLVDMRTSAGMPTATYPWTFEDVGLKDIPLALGYIADACGTPQVDVFAHCMGSAMLWMGLLARPTATAELAPRFQAAIKRLQGQTDTDAPALIHRLCMSQIAPMMRFKEGNLLRAYIMRYVRQHLPLGPYRFKPDPKDTDTNEVLDQVMERLLATIPYPEEEFDIENPVFPPWKTTPWARTRRRMDALYGRDFNIRELDQPVLDFMDDHFGPLNLNTLSQALHLARNSVISDRFGMNCYVTPYDISKVVATLDKMMSVHGEENGLADIRGLHDFHEYVTGIDPSFASKYQIEPIAGLGHQDCLIGRNAPVKVFPLVADFFNQAAS
ncbi:MAG TPA: GMC family oxidoreductase N-terminal domain-containing protein [Aquabacterium sp.]|uniref:GMC family oxidoreductase N-terminal domain-containing protein n=1 Tax=Aquabacterium sp. TaxID=1872578 RepID=UPI002E3350D4|nr:GMC family oxidoreductase N-terminal domain-containing protein [Aquabacterium sp.]HEX5354754.1 GMC family oxidoreductase N-terminal domain-containing protein [Aquabacterium sp.]